MAQPVLVFMARDHHYFQCDPTRPHFGSFWVILRDHRIDSDTVFSEIPSWFDEVVRRGDPTEMSDNEEGAGDEAFDAEEHSDGQRSIDRGGSRP